ncbi:MAG: DUF1559 domain-containing protein, partial [Planctomycetia bacterium]|nr:DUF1559 domain-containing protein [Planctomycetia bacterium]
MIDDRKNEPAPAAGAGSLACPMCGASVAAGARKCLSCGETIAVSPPVKPNWLLRGISVLTILGIGAVLLALMLPAVRRARPAARRSQCRNNLHLIGLALFNYEQEYGALPPAYTLDADGKRLHSWRTLILPFLDQAALYNSIDMSKPWDDPVNAEARNSRVPIYYCPSNPDPSNHTTYLASAGPNACFRLAEPRLLSEITDGTSTTLMVIEVPLDRSVPWMSPNDADEALALSIGNTSKVAHGYGM